MTHTECIELKRRQGCPLLIISAVVSLVAIFTFLAATPLHADTIYSGASVGSDGTIYGWGVTDASSMTAHTTQMNSTLSSPKGRSTAGSISAGGDYSRIDLSLPNDDNDTGTYFVTSYHWAYCPFYGWFLNGNQTGGSATVVPYVQIQMTTVSPTSIHTNTDPRNATISVQIFHQAIPQGTNASVSLQVGTASTIPPSGVAVSYNPANQQVTLPPGDSGKVTCTVEVYGAQGPSGQSTVNNLATLSNPTGVTITAPSPGTNAQIPLTVINP